jgi:hypothetical protein
MRKVMVVLFAVVLSFAFLIAPSFVEAGGYGGHGGWRGYHGGYHGGYRYYGGPFSGFGAGFWTGYYPWYYPWYYPGYYYNYAPPTVYDPLPVIEAPPPGYVEPPPVTQDPGTGGIIPPPTTSQIPPNSYQRRCQKWAPTGEFHNESRWNPQKQTMETVSVPNFAWQDYPCK